jgi:hypothetical protein
LIERLTKQAAVKLGQFNGVPAKISK